MSKLEAIEVLLKCDPTTIIDDNWWDYFMFDPTYYNAMLVLSDYQSYKSILKVYEGYLIRDFICDCINIEY
jgi:hypothetical protein